MRALSAPPRPVIGLLATALLFGAAPAVTQQLPADQTAALRALVRANPDRTELITIGTSPGGRAIHALRVGAAGRPSLLVIAGAHGPHWISTEIALSAARRMLEESESTTTVWFIPRLNPDAAEAAFASLQTGRTANDGVWDDDRDGVDNEDPVDDLNGDGVTTQMRLRDPNGAWIADSADPRLLRRADESKGEVGMYALESEGRDDDADGRYNEDGPGGTDVTGTFPTTTRLTAARRGCIPSPHPRRAGWRSSSSPTTRSRRCT
jgi:hypothetical protein